MSKEPETIIIIDDRLWRSLARDTYTAGSLLAVTMIGRWLDISALAWIGGLSWVVFVLSSAKRISNNNCRTLAEAREYLDKLGARHAD